MKPLHDRIRPSFMAWAGGLLLADYFNRLIEPTVPEAWTLVLTIVCNSIGWLIVAPWIDLKTMSVVRVIAFSLALPVICWGILLANRYAGLSQPQNVLISYSLTVFAWVLFLLMSRSKRTDLVPVTRKVKTS